MNPNVHPAFFDKISSFLLPFPDKMRNFAKNSESMKKIPFLLILIGFTLLAGCRSKDDFTLKGQLQGLPSDTLWVYYQHPSFHLDTLITDNGTFTYTFTPDTLTVFTLTLPGGEQLPIYADKGQQATLSGNPQHWQVEGTGENARLAQLRKHLTSLEKSANGHPISKNRLMKAVDSCILAQPYSLTNFYLINRYYVQDSLPDIERLKGVLKGVSGQLKDTHYLSELIGQIKDWPLPNSTKRLSYISYPDKDGRFFNSGSMRNKYVLINFWASWHPASAAFQDSLASVQKAMKKENFLQVSFSLDLDRQAWLQACGKRDTAQWRQICDFKGWENTLVKQQGIEQLPANLLINPDKQIIARNLQEKNLIQQIKELIQKDKEKNKRKPF